jgi:MarR family transcriptional regulator, organic hydroperoxide resistance regulator
MSGSSVRDSSQRRRNERQALLGARSFIDDMRTRYRELERQTGASIPMHRALACIAAEPGLSASRLATALGMKRPAVSHVLKGLVERGWVERQRTAADQRAVLLHLTAAGRQTVQATAGQAVGTLQRAMGKLNDAEIVALATGLAALLRALPTHADQKPRKRSRVAQ